MRIDGRKLDHAELEQIRFAAIKAVQAGEAPTAVARRMGLYPNRLFLWLGAYRKDGWQALRARKATGRPRRLDARQIRLVQEAVTRNSPLNLKQAPLLWTRERLRTLIAKEFGIKLSSVSVGRLMSRLGIVCERLSFDTRSPTARQWLKQEYPRIRAQARRAGAELFVAQEAVVQADPLRDTLLAGGGRSSAAKAKARHLMLLSAASGRNAPRFILVSGTVGAEVLVDFLQRLIYERSRPVHLLLIDAPASRSGKVRAYVESLDGRLRLLFLPSFVAASGSADTQHHDIRMSAASPGGARYDGP